VEKVKDYAARRGVTRRTVINWIRRGFLIAHRKGYGLTSAWIITDTKLPDDQVQAITHQVRTTSAALRQYLERQREATGQTATAEEVLKRAAYNHKEINAGPQPAPAATSTAAPPDEPRPEPHYDPDPEYNQEPPTAVLTVNETMSQEEMDAWIERQLARKLVHE
jgi:hypothetical protein